MSPKRRSKSGRAQKERDSIGKITARGMSTIEAAQYIGVSQSSLRQGRMDGSREGLMQTPPYIKLSRKVLYLRDDLDKWLESHRVGGAK